MMMISIRKLDRIKLHAGKFGTPFEYSLALLLCEADLDQQLKIQEAFPEFVPKFSRSLVELHEEYE